MATALVTGGALNLGKIICLHLADRGYDIALHYNTSYKEAALVADMVKAKGRKCSLFQADFVKDKGEGLVREVFDVFGSLDLLINSASVFEKADIAESDLQLAEKAFAVNFTAPFILMRDFALLAGNGVVINLLDQSIKKALPKHVLYSVSKSALYSLTKAASLEFSPQIRVVGIAPGLILAHTKEDIAFFEKHQNSIPLKKAGDAANILTSLDYIIDNDFVAGDVLFVDGGQSLS